MPTAIVRHLSARSSRILFGLAACAAAAWLIGQKIDWGQSGPVRVEPGIQPVASMPPVAPARLAATNWSQASRDYAIPVGHAMFEAAPPPSPETTSEPQSFTKKDQFRLTGTAIFGDKKIAVLLETASGAAQVVTEGEVINGILVERIEPERMTLSMAGRREHLEFTPGPAMTSPCSQAGAPCSHAAAAEPAPLATTAHAVEPVPSATTAHAVAPRTAELRAARAQRRLERAAAKSTR